MNIGANLQLDFNSLATVDVVEFSTLNHVLAW